MGIIVTVKNWSFVMGVREEGGGGEKNGLQTTPIKKQGAHTFGEDPR